MSERGLRSGMLVFPNLTQLDLTGPYEVLSRLPGAETLLLWKDLQPVRTEHGLAILPTAALAECPLLDLVLVPGGPGINPLLEDQEVLSFLRDAAARARYVVSVCTAPWCWAPPGYCAGGVPRRTGCRGICCPRSAPSRCRSALCATAISSPAAASPPASTWRLRSRPRSPGRKRHRRSSWRFEYDPAPPFAAGSPEAADPEIVAAVRERAEARQRDRAERVARAAAALNRQRAAAGGAV